MVAGLLFGQDMLPHLHQVDVVVVEQEVTLEEQVLLIKVILAEVLVQYQEAMEMLVVAVVLEVLVEVVVGIVEEAAVAAHIQL